MHGSVLGFFAYGALQQREVRGKDVLDVGSANVNGSVKRMVLAREPRSYLGVDIVEDKDVDRILDANDLYETFGCDAFDVVVSTEMMEHAEDWRRALTNMVAVLRPGGVLVITTRSQGFAYHHPPDYWRYTQDIFEAAARALGLEIIVLMDDPEFPGVFVKLRKPEGWLPPMGRCLESIEAIYVKPPLHVLGLPHQPDGTGYYRFWQPYTALQKYSGMKALIPPPGNHMWKPEDDEADQFDIIAGQRVSGRAGKILWNRWSKDTKLVYETDDAILAADSSSLPNLLNDELADSIRDCLKISDAVTTSTEPLAEQLRKYNPTVYVVPDMIHEDLLEIKRPETKHPTIVWAGGDNHLQDFAMIQDPLR